MEHVAIIGATGVVGREIAHLLLTRSFPLRTLSCYASSRSAGKTVESIPVKPLQDDSFQKVDLIFFCAGASVSRKYIPLALKSGARVIDCSSAFRADPDVPLVIPEINPHAITEHHRLIASPNCAATILLLPLFPLHRLYRAKRIIVSTYQAASGGGASLMNELKKETLSFLKEEPYQHQLPSPYAFNLFLHTSDLHEDGYVEEEKKILFEVRKILEDPLIRLSATCVRVPVLRAHAVSANVEFHRPANLEEAHSALHAMPGLRLFEDRAKNRFPTPRDATGIDEVLCGRVRFDSSHPTALEFWAVGDQLLKGAALNAFQIAKLLPV